MRSEKLLQRSDVDRLREMRVETCLERAAPVLGNELHQSPTLAFAARS